MLETIRHPPQNVCLRVVLWWLTWNTLTGDENSDLLDVCGLGLKIDHRFFEAIVDRGDQKSVEELIGRKMVHSALPTSPFQPTYTVVGTQIATVARQYLSHQADPPPVLLIVGWDDNKWDYETLEPGDVVDAKFIRSSTELRLASSRGSSPRSGTYHKILDQLLEHPNGEGSTDKHLLTLSIFPMMHLDTLRIQAETRSIRRITVYQQGRRTEGLAIVLQDERFALRRHIEDSESSHKNVARFAKSQDCGGLLTSREYLRFEELWGDAISEARLLESEVRDILQLQTGQSSLQESKKSIELSNYQIEESRRAVILGDKCMRHIRCHDSSLTFIPYSISRSELRYDRFHERILERIIAAAIRD